MTKIYHGIHIVWKACVESWSKRANGTLKSLRFGVSMVYREPNNHFNECYFCLVDLKGFNRHKKNTWNYPDLESARQPLPHCEEVSVPEFSDLLDVFMEYDKFNEEVKSSASDSGESVFKSNLSTPEQFNLEELCDLIRDLNLSTEASEILASPLKTKTASEPKLQFYRTREKKLLPYFLAKKKKNLFSVKYRRTFTENGSRGKAV